MQTLIETDVGCIKGETHPELGLFVHVDMYQWDRKAIKEAKETFAGFIAKCKEHGLSTIFAGIPKTDPKNEKFAVLFGFEPTEYDLLNENKEYVMTLWKFELE